MQGADVELKDRAAGETAELNAMPNLSGYPSR